VGLKEGLKLGLTKERKGRKVERVLSGSSSNVEGLEENASLKGDGRGLKQTEKIILLKRWYSAGDLPRCCLGSHALNGHVWETCNIHISTLGVIFVT
jgi:hypothetical protein